LQLLDSDFKIKLLYNKLIIR